MLHQNWKMEFARIGSYGTALISLEGARGSEARRGGVEVNSSSRSTQGLVEAAGRQREWTIDSPIFHGVTIMIRMSTRAAVKSIVLGWQSGAGLSARLPRR